MSLSKRDINGILLLEKPQFETSNKSLQSVKRCYGAKKAGHGGSLDPIATGMLVIAFGEATKYLQFLLNADKEYIVKIKIGEKTTTGDTEGEIIKTSDQQDLDKITEEQIIELLKTNFTGEIKQIPPMYSAIKKDGQPLYKLARQGIEVEREARIITIKEIHLLGFDHKYLEIRVACTKGTYIRTLAEDICESLGVCGHVVELHRTKVANFLPRDLHKFSLIEELSKSNKYNDLDNLLLPISSILVGMTKLEIPNSSSFYLRSGQSVLVPNAPTKGLVALHLKDSDKFIGIGEILDNGKVAPKKLVSTSNSRAKDGIMV